MHPVSKQQVIQNQCTMIIESSSEVWWSWNVHKYIFLRSYWYRGNSWTIFKRCSCFYWSSSMGFYSTIVKFLLVLKILPCTSESVCETDTMGEEKLTCINRQQYPKLHKAKWCRYKSFYWTSAGTQQHRTIVRKRNWKYATHF